MRANKKMDEMLPEYDFSKAVRGKYAKRYAQGTNVVVIEPELNKEFPNAKAVNDALRKFSNLKKIVRAS
jgi:hypothetical protein